MSCSVKSPDMCCLASPIKKKKKEIKLEMSVSVYGRARQTQTDVPKRTGADTQAVAEHTQML